MKNNEKREAIIPIDKRKKIKVIFPDYIEEREKDNLKKQDKQGDNQQKND